MIRRISWSVVFLALAVSSAYFIQGSLGVAIGTLFVIAMVVVWLIPWGSYSSFSEMRRDPATSRLLRIWLLIGVCLLSILLVMLVFPPQWVSWVLIAIGLGIIVWIIWQAFKK
ncbi:MAG: hypothetical protein KDE48_08660 [Anaerolineales bacterium]|nr:hypothetical protein [Anaerolineales bacterium]